jgi:hypothetical protein
VPATPPAPPPPVPTGDYTHIRSIWISPRVVPWVAPLAFLLLFILSLSFTWAYAVVYPSGSDEHAHNLWGWGFGQNNVLAILYDLLFALMLVVLLALAVLRLMPDLKLPAALQQVWPWRSGIVALLAAVTLFFLVLQLFVGFTPKSDPGGYIIITTAAAWGALLLHFIGLVALLLDFWLEIRGPNRPIPRIDISW